MSRHLSALVLVLGLFSCALCQEAKPQTQPKPKPKQLPRIAINEPNEAKKDQDFAVQGEYAAKGMAGQVVAQGEGKFLVKMYLGGLPGAGWDKTKAPTAFTAERVMDKVVVKDKDKELGTIAESKLEISTGEFKGIYERTERKSETLGKAAPSGATVLFSKPEDVSKWNGAKVVKLSDGEFLGVGEKTKETFGSFEMHLEFRLPWMPNSRGQQRANSGCYLQDRYEVQVLDSFGLKGANNECAGLYTLAAPTVNMCLPPMVWQTYDIDFTAATFDAEGKKVKNAVVTVLHNNVKVHDKVEIKNSTGGGAAESNKPGPIQLQNHNDPLVFRNVWLVEKK